jgi:hypothetical protein
MGGKEAGRDGRRRVEKKGREGGREGGEGRRDVPREEAGVLQDALGEHALDLQHRHRLLYCIV